MGETKVWQGDVVMRREDDGRCVIESAPDVATMSLELLASSDPVLVKVRGRSIRLAGQVTYEVTGWDELSQALLLRKVAT